MIGEELTPECEGHDEKGRWERHAEGHWNHYDAQGKLDMQSVSGGAGGDVGVEDVTVTKEGVRFGKNCWLSHEKITGYNAESLNSGHGGVTGRAYMDWVRSRLATQPPKAQDAATAVAGEAVEAVLAAVREWGSERTISDWCEADLMKAIVRLDGDWPGCDECDHQCDEPCMPATVVQMLASIDAAILASEPAKPAEQGDADELVDLREADAMLREIGLLCREQTRFLGSYADIVRQAFAVTEQGGTRNA